MKAWQHFKTVNRHRFLVMKLCFRLGLYWQGLTHDLSKYSPTEFRIGAKYYAGTRSPNAVEREECGYSTAWMHHKGRNRHHYEYWSDLDPVTRQYLPVPMPRRYLAEMFCDRIAACMVYHGRDYRDDDALKYFLKAGERPLMHPDTARKRSTAPSSRRRSCPAPKRNMAFSPANCAPARATSPWTPPAATCTRAT